MINFYDINIYFIFLIGLMIGSFLNVVIYRMPREMSFAKGRSKCASCGHQLSWYDLFPLFSYLFLGGKCRYCKEKISVQYPLVEATTASIFTLIYSYITYRNGSIELYHLILFVIACFVVVGIFTDFLYHGTFDFSTIWVCILFFIYAIFSTKSILTPIKLLLQSLSYFIPIVLILLYINFKAKGKLILSILSLISMIVVSMYSLLNFKLDIYTSTLIINSIINWFSICVIVFIADYIIKKCFKSPKIKSSVNNIANYLNFIMFFLFIFNTSEQAFSIPSYKEALTLTGKNIAIIFLFSLFYRFFIELFDKHNNDEEVIDNDEEIIDRDENIFSQYIGDGDLFIIPFIGMILGYSNVFNFYTILGFSVLSVYTVIFRKGFKYSIPLYPFIIFSIFILL